VSHYQRRRHLTCLALLVSGLLAACGRLSENDPAPPLDDASAMDAVAEAPEAGPREGGTTPTGDDQADGSDAGNDGRDAGDVGSDVGDALGDATATGGDAASSVETGADAKITAVAPYFHAGSRLKPSVIRAGDLEVIDGDEETKWHDAKTGDPCIFRVAADGIERCLPAYVFTEDTESNQLSYLDATCTLPAVRDGGAGCDGATPHYLTVEPTTTCNHRTYRLGTARPSSTVLYQKSGNACRRQPAQMGASAVLPLEEVPPETFVAVKRVSRPRHPRMNAWVREGEDGSSEIIGFSQPGADAPCFGVGLDVFPHVCVPGWIQTWDFFSDATCTQHVGVAGFERPRCAVRTNTVLLDARQPAPTCSREFAINGLWQIAGVSTGAFFDTSGGSCTSRSAETNVIYSQGAPIDLASLPKLDVIEVGNGPLKLGFFGFDGVPFLPAPRTIDSLAYPGRFIDVARGEPCELQLFADRTWRCVPSSFQSVMDFDFYYESEDCTGTRDYSASLYCMDPTRKPRGVIVKSLTPVVCGDYLVTDTLELGGASSADRVSNHGLSATCRSRSSSDALNLLTVSKQLNPADVFVPMERVVKE
jgi:hypothetical protein